MKIAVTSIISRPVGPITFGGTEGFTYSLIEGLVRDGHDVHLYAASDSQTSATLHSVTDSRTARETHMGEVLSQPYYLLLAQQLAKDAAAYDLIHDNFFHTYFLGAFSPFLKTPLIHTVHHAFFQDEAWKSVLTAFDRTSQEHFVFVSEYARQLSGFNEDASVIRHGVNPVDFPYNAAPSESFLWLGRMIPEKGADQAIAAARGAGVSLILNTATGAKVDYSYLSEKIEPSLTERIHLQHQDAVTDKVRMYRQARALLFPVMWEEPFGLVMLEAMSCGTPVIAYARGSVPEVVEDGKTGFIINPSDEEKRGEFLIHKTGVAGLKEAIVRINAFTVDEYQAMREASRRRVETAFSVSKMIEMYQALYNDIVQK